jgi:hypothetical protein
MKRGRGQASFPPSSTATDEPTSDQEDADDEDDADNKAIGWSPEAKQALGEDTRRMRGVKRNSEAALVEIGNNKEGVDADDNMYDAAADNQDVEESELEDKVRNCHLTFQDVLAN